MIPPPPEDGAVVVVVDGGAVVDVVVEGGAVVDVVDEGGAVVEVVVEGAAVVDVVDEGGSVVDVVDEGGAVVVVVDGGAVVVVVDSPLPTVIVPVMYVWKRQWKLKVPSLLKVKENDWPGLRSGESHRPSSLVVLCTVPSVSLFVQVTVLPAGTVRFGGSKARPWIEML